MTYGVYEAAEEYLKQCEREFRKMIPCDVTSLYCGPILTRDGENWYAPVARLRNAARFDTCEYKDGSFSNVLHLDKSIPIPDEAVSMGSDISPEVLFCIDHEKEIKALSFCVEELIDKIDRAWSIFSKPYDVYIVSASYLRYVKRVDPNVISHLTTNVYCGPVAIRNNVQWFAPVTQFPYENEPVSFTYSGGIFCKIVHLNKMIPCPDFVLNRYEIGPLDREAEFCREYYANIAGLGNLTATWIEASKYIARR